MKPISPPTICRDGCSLSIQASRYHYSTPRDDRGPYLAFEVGFIEDANKQPITPPDSWKEYADGEFPSDVYGYVPRSLVDEFIASHGGKAAK